MAYGVIAYFDARGTHTYPPTTVADGNSCARLCNSLGARCDFYHLDTNLACSTYVYPITTAGIAAPDLGNQVGIQTVNGYGALPNVTVTTDTFVSKTPGTTPDTCAASCRLGTCYIAVFDFADGSCTRYGGQSIADAAQYPSTATSYVPTDAFVS